MSSADGREAQMSVSHFWKRAETSKHTRKRKRRRRRRTIATAGARKAAEMVSEFCPDTLRNSETVPRPDHRRGNKQMGE